MGTTATRLRDSASSGAIAAAATALAAAALGRTRGRALAPLEASSHVLWGDEAAYRPRASLKYTLPGVAINAGASWFWAGIYETLWRPRTPAAALAGGALTALAAYLLDYRLLPRRLTPGWELRLSRPQLALMFVVLAASLPARRVLRARPLRASAARR
ncbi:MAG TPA: hypothetical protein VM491_06580 [Burkholderiaceae bacterium]|nr:hypothetical protein [Burkholderiaceae bacterium]